MMKTTALTLLGGTPLSASKLLGCSRQAIYKWPDDKPIPRKAADRVLAAHLRLRAQQMKQEGQPLDPLEADAVAL